MGLVEPVSPTPTGVMTEVRKDHVVCMGYKPVGSPSYFVIRSNRPDKFFKDIDIVRMCFLEVKARIDLPKEYGSMFVPYYDLPTVKLLPSGTLFGEYGRISCTTQLQLDVDYAFFEFFLPWIAQEEVEYYLDRTALGACISLTEKIEEEVPRPALKNNMV